MPPDQYARPEPDWRAGLFTKQRLCRAEFLPMREGGFGLGFRQARANFPLALEGANYSR